MQNAPARESEGAVIVITGGDKQPLTTPARSRKAWVSVTLADGSTFTLNGKMARRMRSLAIARPGGLTALDVSRITTRLSSVIHTLRHRYGLHIETIRERHLGGFHARYGLRTRVKIDGDL